ncbi:HAD-IA family hydrolase [Conservatibacter flavescens]|uniref:HAD family hydrolase n=1 Tax=Conservatibacter flavescens TaxID=28161 RepID=A0A2M8S3S4_9PAST|nr:HAD-IA family hydrolase [Conservatibacter flavescens]PJG85805.1 HAD family hydrolase [Conservatibacter flavescens]
MIYYRNLQPFKAISFDLDDTLYENHSVILLAEQQFLMAFNQLSQLNLSVANWHNWKKQTAYQIGLIAEDVTAWRFATIEAILRQQGKSAVEIDQISQQSMAVFLQWRHHIDVPAQSFSILDQLKQRYSLIAITNGNVDPQKIGFTQFDLILCGGKHGRAKPHQDLFLQAAQKLKLSPHEILHIGDNLETDVQGAISAGYQAVWLNLSNKGLNSFPQARILPTVEITHLAELLTLC